MSPPTSASGQASNTVNLWQLAMVLTQHGNVLVANTDWQKRNALAVGDVQKNVVSTRPASITIERRMPDEMVRKGRA